MNVIEREEVNWRDVLEKHMRDYPIDAQTSNAALSLEILRRLERLERLVDLVVREVPDGR